MLGFFSSNFNHFKPMKLSEEDLKEIDQIILNMIHAQKVGDPLEILLLTEDELKNYNEELADARLKKLNARLRQFKFIQGLHFRFQDKQVIISFEKAIQEEQLKAQYLKANEVILPIQNDEEVIERIMSALFSYSGGDLYIDSFSDEQASLANRRLKTLPRSSWTQDEKSIGRQRFNREMDYIKTLSVHNNIQILNWLNKHGEIPGLTFNLHKDDRRFEFLYPTRYQIQCPKEYIPQLIKITFPNQQPFDSYEKIMGNFKQKSEMHEALEEKEKIKNDEVKTSSNDTIRIDENIKVIEEKEKEKIKLDEVKTSSNDTIKIDENIKVISPIQVQNKKIELFENALELLNLQAQQLKSGTKASKTAIQLHNNLHEAITAFKHNRDFTMFEAVCKSRIKMAHKVLDKHGWAETLINLALLVSVVGIPLLAAKMTYSLFTNKSLTHVKKTKSAQCLDKIEQKLDALKP